MIELYTWTTPNGRKVSIMLEECGLPYRAHKINIATNSEQFAPEYLKINPNGKIPSIVDPQGPDPAIPFAASAFERGVPVSEVTSTPRAATQDIPAALSPPGGTNAEVVFAGTPPATCGGIDPRSWRG